MNARSLAALSCVVFAAIFVVLVWRIVELRPMYASSEIRSQTRFVIENARDRYGFAVSYAVPTSLRCDETHCRLTLREPFNLALDPSIRHTSVITWPRNDASSYEYEADTK